MAVLFFYSLAFVFAVIVGDSLQKKRYIFALYSAVSVVCSLCTAIALKRSNTVDVIILNADTLHVVYQDGSAQDIAYHEIKAVRHYCIGKGGSSCGLNIETLQGEIHTSTFENVKELKHQLQQRVQ